jgi:hypothetical protein
LQGRRFPHTMAGFAFRKPKIIQFSRPDALY